MEMSKEMMRIVEKCSAGVTSAFNGIKKSAANAKQTERIAVAENKIAYLTAEIGNLTVLNLDEGKTAGEEITERYQAILEARQEIKTIEEELKTADPGCPHCGQPKTEGMKFCGYCGKEL